MADPPPKGAEAIWRFGVLVIAAVFGGLLFWSLAAPIDGAVIAPGQVVVESNRKSVQHLEGGVVGEVLVREGASVEAGETVARLENTVQRASLALIDAQLGELYARRARLLAERDSLTSMPAAEGLAEILENPAVAAKIEGQRQLFEARRATRATQAALLGERIVQQTERIAGLRAQIESYRAQRRLIDDELAGVRDLHTQGFAPLTRVRALERESERLGGERGALAAAVAEAESAIAEARLDIERLAETAREEAIAELREVEAATGELEERRIAAADALDRTDIRAPAAGRVLDLQAHTVGGVVRPGEALMEIVPGADRLQIAARVAPRDIDKVAVGQKTLLRFSAFGVRATPEADGVVAAVSADAIADRTTGEPYYLVLIDLPADDALPRALREGALSPGMPAEAFIRTGSRPAISYLLKPLSDAMARALREE